MSVLASPGQKPVQPDPNKAAEGALVYSADGTGQTWKGVTDYDSATIVNCSDCYIRGTYTYNPDVTANGDQTFIIPPGGAYAVTFQDVNVADDEDAIAGIDFDALDVSGLAAGATIASGATVKTGEEWLVVVNAVES